MKEAPQHLIGFSQLGNGLIGTGVVKRTIDRQRWLLMPQHTSSTEIAYDTRSISQRSSTDFLEITDKVCYEIHQNS